MINEDAIEILENIQEHMEETDFIDRCAIDMAIRCMRKIDMLENMVREYRQEGRKPHRTITMEDLAYLLGMKAGNDRRK